MKSNRHKWNGRPWKNSHGYRGGMSVGCVNCNCVKEIIQGRVTYFLNDVVHEKAPKCKNNAVVSNEEKTIIEQLEIIKTWKKQ